jgi:MoxR-like ATPase
VALGIAARARAMLRGRDFVLVEDVLDLAVPVMGHRIRVAAYAEGFAVGRDEAEVAIRELVARIPLPI